MRYLFLLLLVGCGGGGDVKTVEAVEPVINFTEVPTGDLTFRDVYYNGVIEHLNDNSWVFTSHTNNACVDSPNTLKSKCRKVNASYVEGVSVQGRITKVEFDLYVADINLFGDLGWNIIYQDWVRIDPNDPNGNHPITTIKFIIDDNMLNACTFNNAWQWDYVHPEDDPWDSLHNHQANTVNGCGNIRIGQTEKIKIITYDSGRVIFYINELKVSDYSYQTKSPTEPHIIQFGQYWNKGFNIENDPLDRVVIRIDNFKRYTN